MKSKLTHLDEKGNPSIVKITDKPVTHRKAVARATVVFPEAVWTQLEEDHWTNKKGAIWQTAVIAGVMSAKRTGELIPLCHPIGLDNCKIEFEKTDGYAVHIWCTAEVEAKTGVEMEAFTGVSIAALTVYDMCKGLSHDIKITDIQLMHKSGGKRNFDRDE